VRNQFEERLWTFIRAEFCRASRAGFSNLLVSFKQPGFKHEEEWRLVYSLGMWTKGGTQYHVGEMGLIPHLPLKLTHRAGIYCNRLPLPEVVQGPTAEPELALQALNSFLGDLGYNTSTRKSKMPLRF
jgi:hypothetical protein